MLTTIVFNILFTILRLYTWALFLSAIVSMLLAFGVLDSRNRFVWSVSDFLYRITEPVLRPIRDTLPNLGGIDLSFWVALMAIQLVIVPLLVYLERGLTYGVWPSLI